MTVNLPYLLLAIALLWFPRQWLRLGFSFKRRRSSTASRVAKEAWNTREPGDPRVSFKNEFSKFRNYVDLLRAGGASVVLAGGLGLPACLSVAEGAPRNMTYAVLALRGLIMFIGLLIQTMRYEKRHLTFYPPIFFIAGLSLGLCDYRAASFAFVLIWTFNAVFGSAQGFLTVYAALMVAFGFLFSGRANLSVIMAALLCFFPVLITLLLNKPLVIFSRKGTHGSK